MLLNDLYILHENNSQEVEDKIVLHASLTINESHKIFSGHFPGNPVMPGVCMIQIIREITEAQLGKKLSMSSADNIKFLAVLNPEIENRLKAEIHYKISPLNTIYIEAKLFYEEAVYFKMKADFSILQ